MGNIRKLVSACLPFLVFACSTSVVDNSIIDSSPLMDSKLYLRGDYNWWDANEEYSLIVEDEKEVRGSISIHLVADGQPYKFKLADQHWSMGRNCGYLGENSLLENKLYNLNCSTQSSQNPIVFRPSKTGIYTFTLVNRNFENWLKITKN